MHERSRNGRGMARGSLRGTVPQRGETTQSVLIVLIDLISDHLAPASFGFAARVRAPDGALAAFLRALLLKG